MNNQFLNSLALEELQKSVDIKRKVEVLGLFFRFKLNGDTGDELTPDGDRTLADYINKIEILGANGQICSLNANDLLAIAHALWNIRPMDKVYVSADAANNTGYARLFIPVFCGQYVESVNIEVADFTASGSLFTNDNASTGSVVMTFSNNKIELYAIEGGSLSTPFSYSLGKKTITAAGDDIYQKDKLNKPVKGIVVRGMNDDTIEDSTDILSQLQVVTDDNKIVYNVRNDDFLRIQQGYFNKMLDFTSDKRYDAGAGLLEYCRRNRQNGEFHIMFDNPIIANSMTMDFTATEAGSLRVLFIY